MGIKEDKGGRGNYQGKEGRRMDRKIYVHKSSGGEGLVCMCLLLSMFSKSVRGTSKKLYSSFFS